MTFEDYISEHEASHITGVSGCTLNRFADAGYFKIETDADGLKLFSKSELTAVFGSLTSPRNNRKAASQEQSPESASLAAHIEVVRASNSKRPVESSDSSTDAGSSDSALPAGNPETDKRRNVLEFLDREVLRLKQSLELQQTLLEQRDRELKDIREQRDWLKARLERLEEKSERDQILLLSETQTIRKLIAMEERRKSPIRLALEWLGINGSPAAANHTIEVGNRRAEKPRQNDSGNAPK